MQQLWRLRKLGIGSKIEDSEIELLQRNIGKYSVLSFLSRIETIFHFMILQCRILFFFVFRTFKLTLKLRSIINSNSLFTVTRDHDPFNRNLRPLIIHYKTFTKWLINYLNNWRLCVFFQKFLLYYSTYFLQKNLNHQKKPLSGTRKKF
jgi:hypothetical protein